MTTKVIFQNDTGVVDEQATAQFLAANIRLPRNPRILDVGGNGGRHAIMLANLFGGVVVSIDKNMESAEKGRELLDNITVAGHVEFVTCDIFEADIGRFDMVAHRGIDVFFENREAFRSRLWELTKDWGYLVNNTFSYEIPPDHRLISQLNEHANLYIKPLSVREIVNEYENTGFTLIASQPLAHISECPMASDHNNKITELSAENEKLLSASSLIFRRPIMFAPQAACKA